jgi:phospholipid/cholesterol/gamma-HCH transport system substrate-binding protein
VLAYNRSGSASQSGYDVQARLAKVDGLGVGTDVRISGIKVGTVSGLALDPKTFLVTMHMNIDKDVQIPDDSSLLVTQAGILGSNYVSIMPGGDEKNLPPGGMIQNSQGSADIMNLVGKFLGGGSTPAPAASTPPPSDGP